jgi:hypothetical protein
MSDMNFLEIARARRLAALATLKPRQNNLFNIADHLGSTRQRNPIPFFTSRRHVLDAAEIVVSDERLAA